MDASLHTDGNRLMEGDHRSYSQQAYSLYSLWAAARPQLHMVVSVFLPGEPRLRPYRCYTHVDSDSGHHDRILAALKSSNIPADPLSGLGFLRFLLKPLHMDAQLTWHTKFSSLAPTDILVHN